MQYLTKYDRASKSWSYSTWKGQEQLTAGEGYPTEQAAANLARLDILAFLNKSNPAEKE